MYMQTTAEVQHYINLVGTIFSTQKKLNQVKYSILLSGNLHVNIFFRLMSSSIGVARTVQHSRPSDTDFPLNPGAKYFFKEIILI